MYVTLTKLVGTGSGLQHAGISTKKLVQIHKESIATVDRFEILKTGEV